MLGDIMENGNWKEINRKYKKKKIITGEEHKHNIHASPSNNIRVYNATVLSYFRIISSYMAHKFKSF